MSDERDTHFAQFAHSLWEEIEDKIIVADESPARFHHPLTSPAKEEIETLIAIRAYDLLFLSFKQYPLTDEEAHLHIIRNCPDLNLRLVQIAPTESPKRYPTVPPADREE